MRLMKLAEFRKLYFAPGSRPAIKTLRRNINAIPGGRIIAGRYYVDLDEHDRAYEVGAGLAARHEELRKSPLLRGLV